MKLYFSPGACSLSPHIMLREAGLPFDLDKVDMKTKLTSTGKDFNAINPKSYVPTLETNDGKVLTEGVAIVTYLADQKPEAQLAPKAGTFERYQMQEWLTYISSELHKTFSPLFHTDSPEATKTLSKEKLAKRFAYIEQTLATHKFLMGDHFTAPDAYLFTMLTWAERLHVDLTAFPKLVAYYKAVGERPTVQAAVAAEKAAREHVAAAH